MVCDLHPGSLDMCTCSETRCGPRPGRRAFTLPELLVVLVIISLVTAAVLGSGALRSYQHREVAEAGRLLQGAIVGARDRAIHTGRPAGIRLLPDPTLISRTPTGQIDPTKVLAYNRVVPIGPAPDYSEGLVTVRPPGMQYLANVTGGMPCLVVEEASIDTKGLPNPPT